ncbi:MAG: HAMP domain-containing sensor histidine kinase [Rhizomicrobium sp.]
MSKQTLLVTLAWSAICVAIAMVADYLVTVALLHDNQGYTPGITFCIALLVSFPTSFILVSSRDKLRKARDELAAARDAAVKANTSKTNFFANMSHELRTPLNAIIGFSQLLETDIFASKRAEYAKLINASAQHLLGLVNDLLDLSKMEAGRIELGNADVALDQVFSDCCALVEPRLRVAHLRLLNSVPEALPPVTGDARALKQIVLNLLTNAIKFSQPEGTIEIFAAVASTGEMVFGVRDEGIGISPEDQVHVFERYGRAQHSATVLVEGTGLGLPIVRGLVEAHGGRVTLQSALGSGTCVTVRLPADRVGRWRSSALAS